MLFDAQATSDLHCAEEDYAAFSSCHVLKAIRSCGAVTQTHTYIHTHTHTHMHARTHTQFFRNNEKGRVVLFILSLFAFFSLMLTSISCVTCHSSRLFIMWYPGTNTPWHKQTNTHSNHVCTCVLALRRLVSRSLMCNNLSTPLNVHGGALVYHLILIQFSFGLSAPFLSPKFLIQSS